MPVYSRPLGGRSRAGAFACIIVACIAAISTRSCSWQCSMCSISAATTAAAVQVCSSGGGISASRWKAVVAAQLPPLFLGTRDRHSPITPAIHNISHIYPRNQQLQPAPGLLSSSAADPLHVHVLRLPPQRRALKIDDEQLLPRAVFRPWDGGLPCWRIPAAVHIPMGVGVPDTLILFAEGRWIWGDGCNAPGFGPCHGSCKEPTEPVTGSCQSVLDAVCNAPENIDCLFDSREWRREQGCADQPALPLVGLFDAAFGTRNKTWRCYGRNSLDPTHKHWNGTCTGYCSEDEALLSKAYSTAPACGGAGPWPLPSAHPPSPPGAKRAVFSRTSTDNGIS
eukprot:SAG22_NODE_1898_length_3346_cov_6.935017_2_plen_338_part_00